MSTNTPEQNDRAIYPRLSLSNQAGSSNNNQTSDWWLRDGSFLRLKNFEIGYTLPKKLLGKNFIRSLRFYVAANNLLTFCNFKLWDPELNTNTGLRYPAMRSVMFGVDLNF